jgi:alpha-beta hydrolase superfamily lysophospholipase
MTLSAKLLWSVAAALVAAGATGGCATIDRWQREAIFQTEVAARVDTGEAPVVAEEFDILVPGGGETGSDRVHFWYLAAAEPDAPTVLYLHGARHNLYGFGNVGRIERLHELGFNVLALDYRGFGRSTRILPTEATALQDAALALAELQRRQPFEQRRLLYGYSLGGAVAIALAQQHDGVAGVVVESTFTNIVDVVRQRWLGGLPLLGLVVTQKFDSLARIGEVNEPLLILHGTADGIVPHTMADRLYEAARGVPPEFKRVVKLEGATHRGVMTQDRASFARMLDEFVALTAGAGRMADAPAAAAAGAGGGVSRGASTGLR